jgi:hypothetical protein
MSVKVAQKVRGVAVLAGAAFLAVNVPLYLRAACNKEARVMWCPGVTVLDCGSGVQNGDNPAVGNCATRKENRLANQNRFDCWDVNEANKTCTAELKPAPDFGPVLALCNSEFTACVWVPDPGVCTARISTRTDHSKPLYKTEACP